MKRRWMFGLAALTLAVTTFVAAPPLAAQETILGFLENPAINDCRPHVTACTPKPGVIRMTGWALATSGIRRVVIQVDGVDVGQAGYGLFRPEVLDAYPNFPDSAAAGFGFHLNGSDFPNGIHRITAKVLTNAGRTIVLPAIEDDFTQIPSGVQEVLVNYNTNTLHPFGQINFPQRNAELYGTCDRTNPDRRYSVIEGWTLDLGVEIGDAGIAWVELLVDGALWGNTRLNCFFSPFTGGLSHCYGLPRLDVERRFPFAVDAATAGFRFVLDVGFLLDNGYVQGSHTLTIRSGDISNQNANVDEFPVNFFCEENVNEKSFGWIESPRVGRPVADLFAFRGWALDGEGVDRVDVYVDGEFVGEAGYGPGFGTRPAVLSQYPSFPDSLAPVWELFYDSNDLSDGFHQVQVIVTDSSPAADTTLIGEVTFFVNNGPDDE